MACDRCVILVRVLGGFAVAWCGGCSGDAASIDRTPGAAPDPAAAVAPHDGPEAAGSQGAGAPANAPATPVYTMDAMVGQVNGEPVYAAAALEPIAEQLEALGRTRTLSEFRQSAGELIAGRLRQIVIDALILSQAEGDLSAGERAGLDHLMKKKREELVLRWGRGSVAVAEDRLLEETGRTLDQTLNDTRERMLVQRYLQVKLLPQINVTRKDIERYYVNHHETYNPPARRTVRLIKVPVGPDADAVEALLDAGEPFDRVAAEPLNRYHHGQGGLMSEPAVGDQVFDVAALNDALLALEPGRHSVRVDAGGSAWWVYLEAIDRPRPRPLLEVQLEIEELLRRQQFQDLTQRYRRDLYLRGSFNPIDEMSQALLSVAVSRYAQGS